MVQNVLTVADFDNILDNYHGRQVEHIVTTKSISNITGEESFAEAAGVDIKCVMTRTGQNWDYAKAGFLEKGDAVGLCKVADGVKKDDILVMDGIRYRVREAFTVYGVYDSTGSGTTAVYIACNCFVEEDE